MAASRRPVALLTLLLLTILTGTATAQPFLSDTEHTPDPDLAQEYRGNTITIDINVTDTTTLDRIRAWLPEIRALAWVNPAQDTYEPGDTVTIEFGDTADEECSDAWFGVELREPGSSSTTLSGTDSLSAYDGSVFEDQLITGDISISLPSDAKDGTWETVGYLYCEETNSIVGSHDADTFEVDAPDTDDSSNGDTGDDGPDDTDDEPDPDPVEAELTSAHIDGKPFGAGERFLRTPGDSLTVNYEAQNIGDSYGDIEIRVIASADDASTIIADQTHSVSSGSTVTGEESLTFTDPGEFTMQIDALADGGNDAWWDEPIIDVANDIYYIEDRNCVSVHPVNAPDSGTYDTQTQCEQSIDDGEDDGSDDDSGDDRSDDRHWLDQVFLDLWNQLTGFLR